MPAVSRPFLFPRSACRRANEVTRINCGGVGPAWDDPPRLTGHDTGPAEEMAWDACLLQPGRDLCCAERPLSVPLRSLQRLAPSGSSGSVTSLHQTASNRPVSWQSGLSPRHPFRPCGIVSELVTKLPTAVISVCGQSGPARMFAGRWQVIWAVCRAMWAAEGGCCQLIRAENGDVCRSGDGCLQAATSSWRRSPAHPRRWWRARDRRRPGSPARPPSPASPMALAAVTSCDS